MRRFDFLFYDVRIFLSGVVLLFIIAPLVLVGVISGSAGATSSNQSNSNPPDPYRGGAPVVKIFYPDDGSTVTITSTGAVIKQAKNGTPYRQGWVDPNTIGTLHSADDLNGRIQSGVVVSPFKDRKLEEKQKPAAQPTIPAVAQTTRVQSQAPTTAQVTAQQAPAQPSPQPSRLPEAGPASTALTIGSMASLTAGITHYLYRRKYS